MMERQRTFFTTHADPASLFAIGTGGILILVVLLGAIENTSVLFIALLYILMGTVIFGARQTRPDSFRKLYGYLALSGGHAIALLVLPTVSSQLIYLWIGIAGLSIIPPLIISRRYNERDVLMLLAPPLVGAVVGALIGYNVRVLAGEVVLGLGVLIMGSLSAYFSMVPEQTRATSSPPDSNQAFSDDLRDLAMRMHVTVEELVSATQAINSVTMQQSSGANEQADVIKLTNTLLEDFLQLSDSIKSQAHAVQQTAQQSSDISQQGQTSLEQAISGMEEIRKQVSAIGQTLTRLAQLTQRIDDIITSVGEIATQSNLLALNASIEAARAGVHGRGFAVVADEVRTLAQQSTQSAAQIRAILVEIQQAMKETVRATQVGMQGVVAGSAQTREANDIMIQLAESVDDSHHAVESIYTVIRQQVEGLEEISISMERINRITQQNLASTRTVEMVSTNLTRLSNELQAAVDLSQGLKTRQIVGD